MSIDNILWVELIAARVGYFGLGQWLGELRAWLGSPDPFQPLPPQEFANFDGNGIKVRLHNPWWDAGETSTSDIWVLYEISIDGQQHLPFGLDGKTENPTRAQDKLSQRVFQSSLACCKVTYFLSDLRVVTVTFQPNLVGIDHIAIGRLFAWQDWRLRNKRSDQDSLLV